MSFFPWMVAGSLTAVAGLWMNLERPQVDPTVTVGEEEAICGLLWQEWTPGAVEKACVGGRPVWFHVSSDWGIGTKLNEERIFSNQKVMRKVVDSGAVLLGADFTNRDPEVEAELKKYGRFTIPTDIIFPGDSDRPMIVLPEILTPEDAIEALEKAAR